MIIIYWAANCKGEDVNATLIGADWLGNIPELLIDGVLAAGQREQVQFCQAAALTSEDRATVQQQLRARVLYWFARAVHLG